MRFSDFVMKHLVLPCVSVYLSVCDDQVLLSSIALHLCDSRW